MRWRHSGKADDEAERAGCNFPRLVPVNAIIGENTWRDYTVSARGNGAWQVVADGPAVTLASGSAAAARAYTLSLSTRGSIISARIDGVPVATVTNRMYRYGPAGLGSFGYYPVRYPGFTVRPQAIEPGA